MTEKQKGPFLSDFSVFLLENLDSDVDIMYNKGSSRKGSVSTVKTEWRLPAWITNNQLKILALITMTVDHIGVQLLTDMPLLRIIGRLSFPIFAYMIAEGCRYTRDRKKYLLTLAAMALLFQLVYFFAMGSLYQGIFVTFTLAVSLIFAIDRAREKRTVPAWLMAVGVFLLILFLSVVLPRWWKTTDFAVDYDIWGVLLPVLVYFAPTKGWKLTVTALDLTLLALSWGGRQWFALLALIPLACYNGKRGKRKLKNLFYIYYPAHLVVIFLLDMLF